MGEETIRFYAWGPDAEKHTIPPISAEKSVAPYWKDLPRFHGEGDEEAVRNKTAKHGKLQLGLKNCMPFFDAMTSGYQYRLHTNLYVNRENGEPKVTYNSTLDPFGIRPIFEMPTPHGHYNIHFSWQMWWGIATPPGWSCLITHPLNRYDLPFTTVTGIADFDKYPMPGNISFHIKDNFEGIIESGTPIFSIIPIKRAEWTSKIDPELLEAGQFLAHEKQGLAYGNYTKNYREAKVYKNGE
jgi:hypothetical protein